MRNEGARSESVVRGRATSTGDHATPLGDSLSSPAFRELLDCIEDFVLVLDRGLRVVRANRAATVFFGYAEDELIAKRLALFIEAGERKAVEKFIRETEERRGSEAAFLTRSRGKVVLRFSLSPLGDAGEGQLGYLLVGRSAGGNDVLHVPDPSNGLVRRLLEGFTDPLFIVDGSSRTILECNAAALAVLGFAREELVGWRLLSHAASEEERERNETLMAKADKAYAEAGIFQERLFFPRKHGPPLPCDFIGLPVFNADRSLAFVIAMLFDRSSDEDRDAELASLVGRAERLAADLAAAASGGERGESRSLSMMGFTARQIEIARLVALGASSKDIGSRLGIAESTVRNHLAVMFRKLGVASRMSFMHVLVEQRIRIA